MLLTFSFTFWNIHKIDLSPPGTTSEMSEDSEGQNQAFETYGLSCTLSTLMTAVT